MANDRELDQLQGDQERAFFRQQEAWQRQNDAWQARKSQQDLLKQARNRQQEAYDVQQSAWENRRSAQRDTSRAYEAKQDAHDDQQAAWDELKRLRDYNGPRIGQLREEHDEMFDRRKSLSQDIDNAFSWGNKDDAFRMIDEVKQLQDDMRDLPPQWRELSAEIGEAKKAHEQASERFKPLQAEFVRLRSISDRAKAEHEAASADFKAAQAARLQTQAEFDAAKLEHERRAEEFREAKEEADRTKNAFSSRLSELRAEQQQYKDDKRSLAQQAGVPSAYWDDVWVSIDNDGNVNIYFGGAGEPVGPGHGHYAMDVSGYVTYRRDPLEEHGAHNFTDHQPRSRPSKGPWTPSASEPPFVGIVDGTEGGLDNTLSFKVNQAAPPFDDVLIADGDYSDDKKGFDENHDHSWYDPQTGKRGYRDRGKYTGPGGSSR